MKRILFLVIAAVLFTACQNKKESATSEKLAVVTGKVAHFTEPLLYFTYNQIPDTVALDAAGNFEIQLDITEPTFLFFNEREEWKGARMYVKPSTTSTLTIDEQNNGFTTFGGDNKVLNDYSLTQQRLMDTVDYYDLIRAEEFATFQQSCNALRAQINYHLDTLKANWATQEAEFIALEEKRIETLMALFHLTHYNFQVRAEKDITNIQAMIDAEISKVDLNDAQLLKLQEADVFLPEVIGLEIARKSAGKQPESMEEYLYTYFFVVDSLLRDSMREYVYYTNIKKFLGFYGAQAVKNHYENFKIFAKNEAYVAELDAIFADYKKLEPGNPSVNWQFPDKDGKMYQLSDFKGKYVYIDVWATWCGPCLRETPALKELVKRYAGKNIEFIQISVDEDRAAWLKMIEEKETGCLQLYASKWDNEICNFFKIGGIPCFILIDTEGNIVNANAPRPSYENIDSVLNALLGE